MTKTTNDQAAKIREMARGMSREKQAEIEKAIGDDSRSITIDDRGKIYIDTNEWD